MHQDSSLPRHADYFDFELEIGLGTGRDYPVALLDSPAGEARVTMHFPYDELALDLRLGKLQIALLRSGGKHRRIPSSEEKAVQDFGQALFDALFCGRIRTCYDVSLHEAAQQECGLRLKLRIQSPELSALPWEFLYDPEKAEYVCLSRQTPIVRYLESSRLIKPLTVSPPLRILGMVASPQDLPGLDVERERQRVERATRELRDRGLLELEWLSGQTWRDLQEAMWGGPWHIFHFIGHGGFDAQTDEGFIALADRAGRVNPLNATRLGRLLADHTALRLVLLNACEGAKGGERDIYSSTASILVHRGIPAVVAMQYGITDRAAIEFARAFYRALAYGLAVDEAVVAARKAIDLAVTNTVEWGTPVLYMRTPDGVLFDLSGAPAAEAPMAEVPAPAPLEDRELERRLQERYTAGLSAFWLTEWDAACAHFQAIVDVRSDYQDAADKLAEAQRQKRWSDLYQQAQAARKAGDWTAALSGLEALVAEEPEYKDAAALLEAMNRQKRLADLYAQAQHLRQAQQWQAVVNVFAQIAALDPEYPDPDQLLPTAEQEMVEQVHRAELDELYTHTLREMDAGRWAEAQRLLRQVQEQEPAYLETKRLLATAESELEREAQAKDPAYPDAKKVQATAQKKLAAGDRPVPRRRLPRGVWVAIGAVALVAVLVAGGIALWPIITATPTPMPADTVEPAESSAVTPIATSALTPVPTGTPSLPGPAPSNPVAGTVWELSDDSAMVYVPAGIFWMGSDESDPDAQGNERPQHQVYLDAFWIDRTMVTNVQYRRCVGDGVCGPPDRSTSQTRNNYYTAPEFDDYPVIYVDWLQADEYCTWADKRLPTEAEWEKAARGTDGRIYPWGNEFDGSLANFCDANCWFDHKAAKWDDGYTDTAPVGNYPGNASPYGALDMAGNVWEWVADRYGGDYYANSPEHNPQGPDSGGWRAKRGGAWGDRQKDVRSATRHSLDPANSDSSVGFRCARSDSELPQAVGTESPSHTPALPTSTSSITPSVTFTPTSAPISTPQAGATRAWEQDGSVMVYVPAGTFWMGSDDSDPDAEDDEKPQHKAILDAFWLDRTEVTNAMFARFVADTGYETDAEKRGSSWTYNPSSKEWEDFAGADWQHPSGPSISLDGLDKHPVVHVSWNDAAAYCQWAGKRLPTEAEWEKAARGTDKRIYPWGDTFDGSLLNFCDVNCELDWKTGDWDDSYANTAPVGSYRDGASFFGALDMAGNVWEWVADWYADEYYTTSPDINPRGPESGEWRVLRGGSWNYDQRFVRVASRLNVDPSGVGVNVGFRCARPGSGP